MTRKELEQAALKSVCACWHYDLHNRMDETDDDSLKKVIEDPQYFHKHNQLYNPVSQEEYEEELRDCPSFEEK